jgi:hypothetical protein
MFLGFILIFFHELAKHQELNVLFYNKSVSEQFYKIWSSETLNLALRVLEVASHEPSDAVMRDLGLVLFHDNHLEVFSEVVYPKVVRIA